MTPATVTTSGHSPHHGCCRLQLDHLLDECSYGVRILAKVVAQAGAAGQLEHRRSDRRGDGVQTGEYEHEGESQCLGVGERIVAVQELREDPVAGMPALRVDGIGEVPEQFGSRYQIDLVGIPLQAQVDDGVLPRDQSVPVLEGRPKRVRKTCDGYGVARSAITSHCSRAAISAMISAAWACNEGRTVQAPAD